MQFFSLIGRLRLNSHDKFLLKSEKKIVRLGGTKNFEYCRAATGKMLSKKDVEITFMVLKLSILIRGELLLKDNGIDTTSTNINLNAVKNLNGKSFQLRKSQEVQEQAGKIPRISSTSQTKHET